MLSTVLWDFNGTLVADVPLVVRVNNEIFRAYGLPSTDAEAYRRLFGFPVRDYYRAMGVPDALYEPLARDWSRRYDELFPGTPLAPFAEESVKRLRDAGVRQVVLSATRQDLLEKQLGLYPQVRSCFDEVLGLGDVYAVSKVQRGVDYLRASGLKGCDAAFLGDTLHDAETARAMGCACYLISGGHQSDERLHQTGAQVMPSLRAACDRLLKGIKG